MPEKIHHADTSALAEISGSWFRAAPTEPAAPPVATPGVDPISAAVMGVTADWPAVHETLATTRATQAGELLAANGGTATILATTDNSNAEHISISGVKD